MKYYSAIKRDGVDTHNNIDESQSNFSQGKKPDENKSIQCEFH